MKCLSFKKNAFAFTNRTRNIHLKPQLHHSFVKYYSNMKQILHLNNIGPHLLPSSQTKLALSKQEIQSSLFIIQLHSHKTEHKKFKQMLHRQYSMKSPSTRLLSAVNSRNYSIDDMKQYVLIARKTKKNASTNTLNAYVGVKKYETPLKVLRKENSERCFKVNNIGISSGIGSGVREHVSTVTSARLIQMKKLNEDDDNYNYNSNSKSNSNRRIENIFIKVDNKKRVKNGDIAGHFLTRDFIQETLLPKK